MRRPIVLNAASLLARILPQPLRQSLYRLGPLSRLIRRLLNRAAPQGRTEIEVAAGDLQGMRLVLDLQSEKDVWLGNYEPQLQAALRDFAGAGMTVYDIGANIGYITLMLARQVGEAGRVYAFEALPDNVARLEHHVQINRLTDRTIVTHAAVSDRTGPLEFLVHRSHGMGKAAGSAGRAEEYDDRLTVPGIALDDFVFDLGNTAPDLVKMDIEGGEVLALPGMRRILETTRPVLLLELHGQEAAAAAWEVLSTSGYSLHAMRPNYPAIEKLEDVGWKAYLVALPGLPE